MLSCQIRESIVGMIDVVEIGSVLHPATKLVVYSPTAKREICAGSGGNYQLRKNIQKYPLVVILYHYISSLRISINVTYRKFSINFGVQIVSIKGLKSVKNREMP